MCGDLGEFDHPTCAELFATSERPVPARGTCLARFSPGGRDEPPHRSRLRQELASPARRGQGSRAGSLKNPRVALPTPSHSPLGAPSCPISPTSGSPGSTASSCRSARCGFRSANSSWVYGDGCFDMTRSFGHRLFKVKEHVDRLYRSLKYLRIDPGFGPQRMCELTEELFERNRHLLGPTTTTGSASASAAASRRCRATISTITARTSCSNARRCRFVQRAKLFKEGIRVVVPSHRRVPPDSLTPRAKTHNYLNLIVANQEVQSIDPEAWAVLLDVNGNLCEGMGSNIFVVRDGEILTPREKFVLPGVSRQTVIDLAREEGLALREADIDLYDAYNAEEVFLTSTSLCICPVTKVNGVAIGQEIGTGAGLGAGDEAPCRRLPALRRPRFRRPVSQALCRGDGGARVLSAAMAHWPRASSARTRGASSSAARTTDRGGREQQRRGRLRERHPDRRRRQRHHQRSRRRKQRQRHDRRRRQRHIDRTGATGSLGE